MSGDQHSPSFTGALNPVDPAQELKRFFGLVDSKRESEMYDEIERLTARLAEAERLLDECRPALGAMEACSQTNEARAYWKGLEDRIMGLRAVPSADVVRGDNGRESG
jgi:hypothetical protein